MADELLEFGAKLIKCFGGLSWIESTESKDKVSLMFVGKLLK